MCHYLGLPCQAEPRGVRRPWSQGEDELLKPFLGTRAGCFLRTQTGFHILQQGLVPNRTSTAIERRISRLRQKAGMIPTRRPWTPEEDIRLDQYCRRDMTISSIAAELDRTCESTRRRVYRRATSPPPHIRKLRLPDVAGQPPTDQ